MRCAKEVLRQKWVLQKSHREGGEEPEHQLGLRFGRRHPSANEGAEPELNPTYRDLAEHYGVAVIPERVRRLQEISPPDEVRRRVEWFILPDLNGTRGADVLITASAANHLILLSFSRSTFGLILAQ